MYFELQSSLMQLISGMNILNNTWQPFLTDNTFILQVLINLVLCSLKCKYIAVKCALSGIKSEPQLHPQSHMQRINQAIILSLWHTLKLTRSCGQESLILSQLPKQESQCLQGMGSRLNTRMQHFAHYNGATFIVHFVGPSIIVGREYCFQVAILDVVALNLPDYREEFVLELNCVCTWTGSVQSGLGFCFKPQGWKIWHWFFVGPCL
jgi:hypothetical protein